MPGLKSALSNQVITQQADARGTHEQAVGRRIVRLQTQRIDQAECQTHQDQNEPPFQGRQAAVLLVGLKQAAHEIFGRVGFGQATPHPGIHHDLDDRDDAQEEDDGDEQAEVEHGTGSELWAHGPG
jgi:hypothetical protein